MAADPAQDCFEQGRQLLDEGSARDALERFEAAFALDPENPRIRSYYGLCLGLVKRQYEKSLELCSGAAKQEFYNPDLYLNLARLSLAFGFKAEGMRYLLRGRMIDPAHPGIGEALSQLGFREEPVLKFLPRRHPINRWLGSARYLVRRGRQAVAA